MRWGWWLGLHTLLLAAAVLVGVPWPAKVVAALAVLAHGIARRPAPVPAAIVLAADGSCRVADLEGSFVLGPGTGFTTWWVRMDLRAAGVRLELLLLPDQLEQADWARLSARLRRAAASRAGPGPGGPDLG